MFFPAAMTRLTWILPRERLAEGLERLAATGAFAPIDRRSLGRGEALEPLTEALERARRYPLEARATRLQEKLPSETLLHYRLAPLPAHGPPPGAEVARDDEVYLAIGETPGAPVQPLPAAGGSAAALALLVDTAARIGRVADWAIIDGWIPSRDAARFRRLLADEHFVLTPAEESGLGFGRVPSLFRRPRPLAGFAALTRLYGITGYRELDPAPLLLFSFTLMFGMMFADLGQGLLLALLGLWLHRRGAEGSRQQRAGLVLMPVGLSAAGFGVLFGSVFARNDWIPALIHHPMDEVFLSLGISVLIGVGALCLGMAIGLFNAWRCQRLHQRRWDDYGPVGLIFYLAMVTLALAFWVAWPALAYGAGGVMLVCLGALMRHHSRSLGDQPPALRWFQALLESYDFVIKFVVQTLSFVRLAAFTFAHIALSTALMVIVELLAEMPWLAWTAFVLGNLLITAIEGLLVSIQVVRLHFFELFTKFTAGGGIPFQPLQPIRTSP